MTNSVSEPAFAYFMFHLQILISDAPEHISEKKKFEE